MKNLKWLWVVSLLITSTAWGADVVDTLRPTGEGTIHDFNNSGCTNSWECVDEDDSDSLTTTIATELLNDVHQFTFADPPAGTIDSAFLWVHIGYTTGPARQIEISYDTGAGFALWATHDLGNEWTRDTLKFTSPANEHIAALQFQIETIELPKSSNFVMCSWVQITYWYDDGGAAEVYTSRRQKLLQRR